MASKAGLTLCGGTDVERSSHPASTDGPDHRAAMEDSPGVTAARLGALLTRLTPQEQTMVADFAEYMLQKREQRLIEVADSRPHDPDWYWKQSRRRRSLGTEFDTSEGVRSRNF